MPFVIKGKHYPSIVIVGHHYNDTATHQVQVLALHEPSKRYPQGMIEISDQGEGFRIGWKFPVVIGAEWQEADIE